MRAQSPSLHLLRAFTTTVRFGSATRAAEALYLTQSAVSKQIAELEQITGTLLFERVRRRLSLTPAGARYAQALVPLLAQLDAAAMELVAAQTVGGGVLHVSALPTFAARWLIPRLPRFQQAHPQVAIHFVPHAQGYDFSRSDLDCSILFGEGHWPDARADYLCGRDVAVIGPSAGLAPPLLESKDVAGRTLIHHVSAPHAWAAWCAAHGLPGVAAYAGPEFDQFQTLIRAVAAGMGLALVPRCLVEEDIRAGFVQALPADGYEDARGYYLCHPETRTHHAPLMQFRAWLLDAAGIATSS